MIFEFHAADGSQFPVDVATKEVEGAQFAASYVLYQGRLFNQVTQYGSPNIYVEITDFTIIP